MTGKRLCVLLPVLALALAPATAHSAALLKLDGIPGESTNEGHAGEIEISSFQWGLSNPASTGPRRGAPQFSEFVMTKQMDSASPALLVAASSGQRIASARVSLVRGGDEQRDVATYCLRDVTLTSFNQSSGGDDVTESFSLAYRSILLTYNRQNASGSSTPFTGGWDLVGRLALTEPDGCGGPNP